VAPGSPRRAPIRKAGQAGDKLDDQPFFKTPVAQGSPLKVFHKASQLQRREINNGGFDPAMDHHQQQGDGNSLPHQNTRASHGIDTQGTSRNQ
jgi:hypothetical protein